MPGMCGYRFRIRVQNAFPVVAVHHLKCGTEALVLFCDISSHTDLFS